MKNIFRKSLFIVMGCLMASVVWGAEPALTITAASSTNDDWNKTYNSNTPLEVIVSTSGAALAEKKPCGTNTKQNVMSISSNAHYLALSLPANSTAQIDSVLFRSSGNNTGTSDWISPLFYCPEPSFNTENVIGVCDVHLTGYNQPCEDFMAKLPAGVQSCRLYRKTKYTEGTPGKIGSGSDYGSGQTTNITYIEVYVSNGGGEEQKSNIATLNKISYTLNEQNYSLGGLPDKLDHEVTVPAGTVPSDITNFAYDPTDHKVKSKTDDFLEKQALNTMPFTVTITVIAEDETATKTYTVTFKEAEPEKSHDATLKSLEVSGYNIGFETTTTSYNVELPAGSTINDLPNVTYKENDETATVKVTKPTELPGTMTIEVTAQDLTTIITYTINFSVEGVKSDDATLKSLTYGGTSVPDFNANKLEYNIELTYGIKTPPTVAAVPNFPTADVKVTQASSVPGTAKVDVTAEDGTTKLQYIVNYIAGKSNDATLKSLNVAGYPINFNASTYSYDITLPAGSTIANLPDVTFEVNENNATPVKTDATALPGATTIKITAQDGTTTKTYTINFKVEEIQTAKYLPLGVKTFTENTTIYGKDITGSGDPKTSWVVVPNYSTSDAGYTNTDNDTKGNPNGIKDNIATESSGKMIQIKTDGNTYKEEKRVVIMHVKGITAVVAHGSAGSSGRGIVIGCDEFSTALEASTEAAKVTRSGNSGSFIVGKEGLDASKEYVLAFYAAGGDSRIYAIEFLTSGGLPSGEGGGGGGGGDTPPIPDPPATDLTLHKPGFYESKAGYDTKLTEDKGRYFEVYYFSNQNSTSYFNAGGSHIDGGCYELASSTKFNVGWLDVSVGELSGSTTLNVDEFKGKGSGAKVHYAKVTKSHHIKLHIQGFDQFSFIGREAGDKDNKFFKVTINGQEQSFTHSKSDNTIYRFDITNGAEAVIEVTGLTDDENRFRAFSLREAQIPNVRYAEGDTAKQNVRITEKLLPIRYFIKNATVPGKTVKTELSWADNKVPDGISLTFNASKDSAILSGTATCVPGQYRYYITTTLDGAETSRETGIFTVYADLKATTDTLIDAYVGENMEELVLKYYALDASAIHIKWDKDLVPEGLKFTDDKVNHTYTWSGLITASAGAYHFIITMDGNADIRITGSIDVIKQDLGVNPILFLYRDKALRKKGSDDVTDAVFTHLKEKNYNVKARRTLAKLRGEEFYKQFKAIIISEDANADNEEVLDIVRGKVNLPILNMQGFTYPRVTATGWGEPDNGTVDTTTQNGSNIFIQRGEHPIFSKWAEKKTGTKIHILDFEKLKADGINSVMPIAVTLGGTYCLATAYTRNVESEYKPIDAYYKDGERQTIIHEIPANAVRGKGTKKYICFPLSQKCTKYLTADGKQLFESIMAYLLSEEEVSMTSPTLQIQSFSIDGINAVINEEKGQIDLTMDTARYNKLDSLENAAPVITLVDPTLTYVRPASDEPTNLKFSMLVPYQFVVSDYIRRRVYEFSLHLTYPQGIDEVYTAGEWVNIYDIYGRKVTTTNENIYTMDLPRGIYIAVTATGQTIKIMK